MIPVARAGDDEENVMGNGVCAAPDDEAAVANTRGEAGRLNNLIMKELSTRMVRIPPKISLAIRSIHVLLCPNVASQEHQLSH